MKEQKIIDRLEIYFAYIEPKVFFDEGKPFEFYYKPDNKKSYVDIENIIIDRVTGTLTMERKCSNQVGWKKEYFSCDGVAKLLDNIGYVKPLLSNDKNEYGASDLVVKVDYRGGESKKLCGYMLRPGLPVNWNVIMKNIVEFLEEVEKDSAIPRDVYSMELDCEHDDTLCKDEVRIASVFFEDIDGHFNYIADETIIDGDIVKVPFGKGNNIKHAIVSECKIVKKYNLKQPIEEYKHVKEVIGSVYDDDSDD